MLERFVIFLINCFCPPISVMIVAGPSADCAINTLFFLMGVIPAHIHGFYITCTYFHRRRKVRKGRWPGGRKAMIHSRQVWNGGASDEHVRELWENKVEMESMESMESSKRAGRRR